MPEEYDLTLLHPDGKLGRDIAIMRAEIEELHAKLADASCDRPRGTRDHLVDGDNHHLARVVVLRTLMEPWAAVVSAVAVGLVSGLLEQDPQIRSMILLLNDVTGTSLSERQSCNRLKLGDRFRSRHHHKPEHSVFQEASLQKHILGRFSRRLPVRPRGTSP
jgi:hypothetical protein